MPRVCFHRHFQVQGKIGCREPLPSPATDCSQATSGQTTTPACRSPLLGACLPIVFRMEPEFDRRKAEYRCQLASASAGKPIGAGGHAARPGRDAGRSNRSSANSFAVWLGRIPCGDNAESRRNWHVLASGFVRVLSPDTCAVHTVDRPLQDGDNSWPSIATRSGRATYLRFRLSGFKHCTCFLSFTTALVNSCMRGSRLIPIRRGWRNKWSKPAGYRGNHRVT